jgi:Icc protein
MASRRIAHLSDLHIGAATEEATERLVRAVIRSGADRVAITGDVTHRGRAAELARFRRTFAPLLDDGSVVIVPGNHDRLGDDLETELMPGERVQVSASHGTWIVRCNSTGPHNRRVWDSHGLLTRSDLQAIVEALDLAPAGATRVLLLHHHPLPLPGEDVIERLVSRLGLPHAAELPLGMELLRRVRHRCDLLLHGHRHAPAELRPFTCESPLRVFNGGSSTELEGFRVFDVDGRRVDTCWVDARGAVSDPPGILSRAA